jgi:hypothetical protein
VPDSEQRRDEAVATRLVYHAVPCVDQNDRDVARRGTGRHVPRVLLVPGRVGDDELAFQGGEVPVCDVDRDPLLALRAQAVGQQR